MFFIAVYIHMFRGMYYGSYKAPREILWILGVIIFLIMMGTAFMGYVLPWGQMSFWGAKVITNLFSALPLVGEPIVSGCGAAFGRQSDAEPLLLAALPAAVHDLRRGDPARVGAAHDRQEQPDRCQPKTKQDTLPFHPYYTMKDLFALACS
jgi:ubiquinol-cytochrome c reductase cytochrome b/c1 subunit